MLDLLIKNARICDGTGAPSFMGDLGVQDGLIRTVCKANGHTAERVLDADGLVLAPGLRRSAHALRRPDRLGPAPHLLAVARRDHRDHGQLRGGRGPRETGDARDPHARPRERRGHPLRRHEGRHRLALGSYGDYLDAIDRRGLGINVAGLVAFTPLRHYVMGEASFERRRPRTRSPPCAACLREAMEAGAFGFTTTTYAQSRGLSGAAAGLPQRQPGRAGRRSAQALRDVGRGTIEIS